MTTERFIASLQVGFSALWGLCCISFVEALFAYIRNCHVITVIVSVGNLIPYGFHYSQSDFHFIN